MLISIAQRVQDQRTLTRTLLTVVAVAVAVIAGLLAMHSMNTHAMTSGHSDTVAVAHSDPFASGSHHTSDHAAAAAAGDPAAAVAADCTTCSSDHGMAWMACVLALLVAVVLLARPAAWWRSLGQLVALPAATAVTRVDRHTLSPPSLTVLCISRT